MATVVGIALENAVIRAAYRDGTRTLFVEHAWDSLTPDRAVDTLRAEIGSVQTIVLSVGLGFLEVAKPELPAMTREDRRRVLLRGADRYFPLDGPVAVSTSRTGTLAYATASDQLQRWVRAFEAWAPVRSIIAAPDALTAVIPPSGWFVVAAGVDETGLLRIVNGEVCEARRVPAYATDAIPSGAVSLLDSGSESLPGKHSAAVGALSLVNAPLEVMLLDTSLHDSMRVRRTRRVWLSYAFAALALVGVGLSASARREKTLRAVQHSVDSLQTLAAPGLAAKARLAQLTEEAAILSTRATAGNDPLHALAKISESLPGDAFVQRLEWDGKEWRLDGSVNQAATVVPSLDSAHTFANVRVLGASTRFRDGARMRESFAVAFQVKGDSVAKR